MKTLSMLAKNRFSCKKFDASRTLTLAQVDEIKTLLQYSPSSTNAQPWHFVLAGTAEGKARIAATMVDKTSVNAEKILNCSHVLILCAKTSIDDAYLQTVLNQEALDGRFASDTAKAAQHAGRSYYVNMHRVELKDSQHWMEKQVYIALGNLLLGTQILGIEACPIEGFNAPLLNQALDLPAQGYAATVLVALGYRHVDDVQDKLPKSRLPLEVLFTEI